MPEQNPAAADVIEIDLREILNKIYKHRQTIISTLVLSVVLALIFSFTATPIYKSSSRILVESKPPKIVKVEDVVLPDYSDRVNFFNSQIEVLKSHTIADLVFQDLGNYEPWSRRGKPANQLKEITREDRIESLLMHVKIAPVRQTEVIQVNVEDPDPRLAAFIANSWTRAYLLFSSMDQMVQRRSELESDLSQQLKFFRDKHPVIVGLRSEIGALNDKINNERTRINREESASPGAVIRTGDITNVKVLDRAQIPQVPERPNKLLNLCLSLILGLIFGVGMAALFESLDQTLKTLPDMEQTLKLPCLAAIPLYEPEEGHADFVPEFVASRARHSTVSEAFRGLRTGIIFSNPDLSKKTFVVTSSSPSEGKTTVAMNLATVFAQANERTILVDADLRNPRLHSIFKIDRANGITDILAWDKGDIQSFVRKTEIPGLDFLSCGELPPNPSELLGAKKMGELIARLSSLYDRVIFDTPPVLAATDAVVLSTKVDVTILVVKAGATPRQAALRSVNSLRAVHAHLLGAVFNMVNVDEHSSYYYYYLYGANSAKKTASRKKAKGNRG